MGAFARTDLAERATQSGLSNTLMDNTELYAKIAGLAQGLLAVEGVLSVRTVTGELKLRADGLHGGDFVFVAPQGLRMEGPSILSEECRAEINRRVREDLRAKAEDMQEQLRSALFTLYYQIPGTLRRVNEVCAAACAVAERKGVDTNWETFHRRVCDAIALLAVVINTLPTEAPVGEEKVVKE